jgi:hypothetical protein
VKETKCLFCFLRSIILLLFEGACLFQYGQITPQLAIKVLLQFDKSINTALATRVKSRLTFKVPGLFVHMVYVLGLSLKLFLCWLYSLLRI